MYNAVSWLRGNRWDGLRQEDRGQGAGWQGPGYLFQAAGGDEILLLFLENVKRKCTDMNIF